MSDGDTARETVGPVSRRDPEAWCSERGHYRPERPNPGVPGRGHYRTERPRPDVHGRGHYIQARAAEAWCSRTGTLQIQISSTASDGLAQSAFDPSLEYSTDNVLFWQPRPIVRSGRLRRLSSTACHILARSSL